MAPIDLDYDVVIIGAGISGINAGQRIKTSHPEVKYTILEGRHELGGTWSLFRYPGIRSDSDLYTFGFPWKIWKGTKRFASAQEILGYMKEAVKEEGMEKDIQLNHKVSRTSWSSEKGCWTIYADVKGTQKTITTKFLVLGTGYYDYNSYLKANIPGVEQFKGQTIHPQFWPENLDYTDKNVAIIGSGATAVTMLPNMADKARKVTMIQRSPTYILAFPNTAPVIPKWWPGWLTFLVNYFRYLIFPFAFYKFCRWFPNYAKKQIIKVTSSELPSTIKADPHFTPSYNPWDQRLCMSPDGDFYECLRNGSGNVVTGKIKTVTEDGVLMESGEKIDADIVITATGLQMQSAGGAQIFVDGKEVKFSDKFIWRGILLQDVPNLAYVAGYTHSSWTLGADCTAVVVCKLLKHMKENGFSRVQPRIEDDSHMKILPLMDLNSTYMLKGVSKFPKTSDFGPWKARKNYFKDYWHANFGDLRGDSLVYS